MGSAGTEWVAEAEAEELLSRLPELMRTTDQSLAYALAVLERVACQVSSLSLSLCVAVALSLCLSVSLCLRLSLISCGLLQVDDETQTKALLRMLVLYATPHPALTRQLVEVRAEGLVERSLWVVAAVLPLIFQASRSVALAQASCPSSDTESLGGAGDRLP